MSVFDFVSRMKKPGSPAPAKMVLDLDAVVTETLSFSLHGDTHYIAPISTLQFLRISNALVALDDLVKRDQVTSAQIIDAYAELFGSVCKTITRKHIMSMSQAQILRFRQLVMDTVSGKIYTEETEVKKKTEERLA